MLAATAGCEATKGFTAEDGLPAKITLRSVAESDKTEILTRPFENLSVP